MYKAPVWLSHRWFHLLVIWPLFNFLAVWQIIYWVAPNIYLQNPAELVEVTASHTFSISLIFYLLLVAVDKLLHPKLLVNTPIVQWCVYLVILFVSFFITRTYIEMPEYIFDDRPVVFPLFNLSLQITIYVTFLAVVRAKNLQYNTKLYATEIELQMLRSQSAPHFIFNTLNLIANETTKSPELAQDLIYDLSDLLRKTTRSIDKGIITVQKEVELIGHYLILQQKRFIDRLSYSIEVDEQSKQISIPALIILPLVENAVKHGIAPHKEPNHILIKIAYNNGCLDINVHNTVNSTVRKQASSTEQSNTDIQNKHTKHTKQKGMGIEIINKTLALHYDARPQVQFVAFDKGYSALIRLEDRLAKPFEISKATHA